MPPKGRQRKSHQAGNGNFKKCSKSNAAVELKDTPGLRPWAPSQFANRNLKSYYSTDGAIGFIGLQDQERVCKTADLEHIQQLTKLADRKLPDGVFLATFCTPAGNMFDSDRGYPCPVPFSTALRTYEYRRLSSRVQATFVTEGPKKYLLGLALFPALINETDSLLDQVHQDVFNYWYTESYEAGEWSYVKGKDEGRTILDSLRVITREEMISGKMNVSAPQPPPYDGENFRLLRRFYFQRFPISFQLLPIEQQLQMIGQQPSRNFQLVLTENIKVAAKHPPHLPTLPEGCTGTNSKSKLPRKPKKPPLPVLSEQILLSVFCNYAPVLNTVYVVNERDVFTKSFNYKSKKMLPGMCDECLEVLTACCSSLAMTQPMMHRFPKEPIEYQSPDDTFILDHPGSCGNPELLFRFSVIRIMEVLRQNRIKAAIGFVAHEAFTKDMKTFRNFTIKYKEKLMRTGVPALFWANAVALFRYACHPNKMPMEPLLHVLSAIDYVERLFQEEDFVEMFQVVMPRWWNTEVMSNTMQFAMFWVNNMEELAAKAIKWVQESKSQSGEAVKEDAAAQ